MTLGGPTAMAGSTTTTRGGNEAINKGRELREKANERERKKGCQARRLSNSYIVIGG